MSTAAAVPYEEPSTITILIYASIFLVLNLVNHVLDAWLYCGLLGQVLVGIAWGTPGAGWLASEAAEQTLTQVGYLGLILLVYEGGLATSFRGLRADLVLCGAVALTGVALSIGLSFVLKALVVGGTTPLQAFAAGAALTSTSLGTTLTLLGSTGLRATRLGTVLTGAAVLDDVVALALVQVIANLGDASSASNFSAIDVVRPFVVSIGLLVVLGLVCWLVVRPVTRWACESSAASVGGRVRRRLAAWEQGPFFIHSMILLGMVAGASFAGTSPLFAAYLAGAAITWWDTESPYAQLSRDRGARESVEMTSLDGTGRTTSSNVRASSRSITRARSPRPADGRRVSTAPPRQESDSQAAARQRPAPRNESPCRSQGTLGALTFERYYHQPVHRILKPVFFATIGFSIPITQMFRGDIVWRGFVYALLMALAKLLTGVWLVRFSLSGLGSALSDVLRTLPPVLPAKWAPVFRGMLARGCARITPKTDMQQREHSPRARSRQSSDHDRPGDVSTAPGPNRGDLTGARAEPREAPTTLHSTVRSRSKHMRPRSLYPASIIGTAMVARGEVGFLIASIAETSGILSSSPSAQQSTSEIYLVVMWAIVLCTFVGPLGMGVLVKRVTRLQAERRAKRGMEAGAVLSGDGEGSGVGGGENDPLGDFGVAAAEARSKRGRAR